MWGFVKNYILPLSVSEFRSLMEFRDGGIIKELLRISHLNHSDSSEPFGERKLKMVIS